MEGWMIAWMSPLTWPFFHVTYLLESGLVCGKLTVVVVVAAVAVVAVAAAIAVVAVAVTVVSLLSMNS